MTTPGPQHFADIAWPLIQLLKPEPRKDPAMTPDHEHDPIECWCELEGVQPPPPAPQPLVGEHLPDELPAGDRGWAQ